MSTHPRASLTRWARRVIAPAGVALMLTVALGGVAPRAEATPERSPEFANSSHDQIVVKVKPGHDLSEIVDRFPVTEARALLRSRGIFLLEADDEDVDINWLADRIAASRAAVYAEPNYTTTLISSRYHSWPEGPPEDEGKDSSAWLGQPIAGSLDIRDAHGISTGIGVRVAVLDTGIDPDHPAMTGRTLNGYGYDYVDDDSDPSDVHERVDSNDNGTVDDAYGHGTFVAGMVALTAPDARIIPMRVLDSDGVGNVFVVAQAILDAIDQRVGVINISFGTDEAMESQLLGDAIAQARAKGIVVVAASGNDGSTAEHWPAGDDGVLSVGALSGSQLTSWSNRGSWVSLAAPGDDVVGPVPGGEYATWSGTSMAAPIVAGQVALVRSLHPDWTAAQQVKAITSSTRPVTGVSNGAVDLVGSLNP